VRVLLVRADDTPDADARALADHGVEVTAEAFIRVQPSTDADAAGRAADIIDALSRPGAWLVLTSAAGIRALDSLLGASEVGSRIRSAERAGARFAAVGPTSGQALHDHGVVDVLTPMKAHTAAALLDTLGQISPGIAVMPRSTIGDQHVPEVLETRGWTVLSRIVYETTTVSHRPASVDRLAAGEFDALVLRSPSAARAVAHFGSVASTTAIVAGGPTTALAASRLGLHVTAVAADSRAESIAAAVMSTRTSVAP
jgi:uroporphyrinogen-III synthase